MEAPSQSLCALWSRVRAGGTRSGRKLDSPCQYQPALRPDSSITRNPKWEVEIFSSDTLRSIKRFAIPEVVIAYANAKSYDQCTTHRILGNEDPEQEDEDAAGITSVEEIGA